MLYIFSIAVSGSLNRWYVIYNHPIGSIYHLYIANWVIIYHRSHLLREPGNSIDISIFPVRIPSHSTTKLGSKTEVHARAARCGLMGSTQSSFSFGNGFVVETFLFTRWIFKKGDRLEIVIDTACVW